MLSASAGVFFTLATAFSSHAILGDNAQLQLGNPSGATADPANHDHYLVLHPVFTVDYSDNLGQPNWVSWDLTSDDLGSSGRNEAWKADPDLPSTFYTMPTSSYGSDAYGQTFSRGHMCPSADRTLSVPTNKLVFYMSNIIPQASEQNSIIWANLEDYCRNTLLIGGNELQIISGPSRFTTNTFNSGHVKIPSYTWKVVVVIPPGAGTATNRVSASTQVIAVRIPNTNSVASTPWQNFRTNVAAVEADTGFTFFTALPPNVAMALRYKIDGNAPGSPIVSGFSPGTGTAGNTVTITGSNLAFTTNVAFNGLTATYTINSISNISATVPPGATTGPILVAGLGGNFTTSSNFNVQGSSPADLAVKLTHTGNFIQGETGDTYTIVVTNVSFAASTGSVSVTDTLPAGLTATALSGSGWTTDLATLTCTRSDTLTAGAAYPPITVTVSVAPNAPSLVTNTAVLSGGGDTNLANNTALDPTVINQPGAPIVTTGVATSIGSATATLNGTVNPSGAPTTVKFEYGLTASYGTTVPLSGTFNGSSAQPMTTNITGLTPGTLYHFRLSASNAVAVVNGLDQTFTTTGGASPDLAVLTSHTGNFTQGDTNAHYTIVITNLGLAASSGSVTVTDAVPAGLTLTAFSGTGWTFNVGNRTCTRSDALAAGASFPAITVTISVASNAPSLVTNVVSVSGGNDSNPANNSTSDPTIINPSSASIVMLAGWDVSTLPGGTGNFGPTPYAPTTNAANLSIVGLSRGPGLTTSGSAAARAWGGANFMATSAAGAVTAGQYVYFTIAGSNGYNVSYSAISRFDYRHSGQGPTNGVLQYQVGSGAFVDVTNLDYPVNTSAGSSIGAIDLSGIVALQNVPAGTNVTFRIANWNATSSGGTWYIFDVASSTAVDFAIQGVLTPAVVPAADLAIAMTHSGTFTQADFGDTYTITVTNAGTGASSGTVTVAPALPAGLTAAGMAGSGWTVNLTNLTCTRADALPAGAAYPPITLSVNVDAAAPSSVTNVVTVSGGGDVTPGNNTASDPTTIIPLTPVQSWRYYWFGTTANSGNAADGAIVTSDGMPNLVKYALNLPPTTPAANPVQVDINSGFLRLTAPKNPQATDVTFRVEVTSNPTAPGWTTNGTTVDINSTTALQVHDNTSVGAAAGRYIRLSISRP
jgi:uncharacterized repeat protein (TIGR01451 family)